MSNLKKCGKCNEMVDTRGFAMHYTYCKGEGESKKDEVIIDKKNSTKECHECGSKDIIRLDKYEIESKKKFKLGELFSRGYTHVCAQCGELIK